MRPAWWREFLQKVKMFFYGFKGFSNYRFTDKEIETLLLRGYRKTRSARGAKAEGGDARFAALRREGAPNTAEESGQMRDSHVPHEEGFMEKYKFSGKGLYADYEFLYGRHPEYFEDVEHARAAVEFVLAKPEEAVDVEGNAAFVRRDEETGTPYRIEIEKTTRAKYNHIRSVHVLSEQQYEKAKAGATPANAASPVLQPSQNRVRQTDTNGDLTGRQGRTVSDFLRYDSTESGKVKHSPEGGARFSIIGEEGAGRGREAEARMSDLRIAREMETAGKDAKTIKRATGWERGGDGKWRMEIPDLKIKREETLPDGTKYAKSEFSLKFHDGALGEYVDAPELFEAYPELRNIRLAVRPAEMSDTGSPYGYFDKSRNMIVVYSDVSHAEELLVHEVQHAIQAQEGFPEGGDGREMGAEYRKLAGEAEAYNAAKRRKMTAEEKRESLLEETADVAEEDKIYLNGADGLEHSFAEDNFYYEKALDAYFRGEWHVEKSLPLAVRTPDIYLRLKLKDKGFAVKNIPWSLAYSAVRKGLGQQVSTSNGEAHCLRPEDFKKLPDAIYHPVMILDSNTDKSLEIITDLFDQNGKPVLLALRLDVEEEHHKVNSIRSVYGKDNVNTLINKLRDGRGRYVDMKRAADWSQSIGVQFPEEVLLKSRSPYIIIENGEKSSVDATKSEKNLRFSIEQYSDADWSDMVTYMRSKVGDVLNHPDSDYRRMLEEAGMRCYSEADAHACAAEAMQQNEREIRKRGEERRDKWIYENELLYRQVVDFAKSDKFTLVPDSFTGEKFTGTWIAEEYRKYSEKRA